MPGNPFEDILDEAAPSPLEERTNLLGDTNRAYAKMRKVGIQQARASATRPAMLPKLVNAGAALELWLLILALEPVLAESDPLPIELWARLIGSSESAVARGLSTLERLRLIVRRPSGRRVYIRPLMEDGSGADYIRPGSLQGEGGPGFFTIPHLYWDNGYADRLKIPGKMALLIGLSETTKDPTWDVPTTRADEWYGISERTLERGYTELSKENLLLVHRQQVRAKRSATGVTYVYHRALTGSFSRDERHAAQEAAKQTMRDSTDGDAS